MTWTIKLFGPPAQALGRNEITVSVDGTAPTSGALRARLAEGAPALAPFLSACRLAVNCRFVPDEQPLAPGDEIALIGMVSGG